MVARSWGKEGPEHDCLMGMEFSPGVMKMFLKVDRGDSGTKL